MQSEIARLLCLCLILVLPSRVGLATQPVPVRLTHVGKISLEARKVKGKMVLMDQDVVGTKRKLLCFGSGPDLYVYDISAPASPRLLLKKDVTGDTTNDANDLFEVIRSGNYLVLTGSYRAGGNPPVTFEGMPEPTKMPKRDKEPGKLPFQVGFVQILDIRDADPANGHAPTIGSGGRWASFWEEEHCWTASDVELEGEVGNDSCFLHVSGNLRNSPHCGGCLIIDLSDPATPKKRGDVKWTRDGDYMGHGVTFDGRYQYHGNYFKGVYVVDYSDPDRLVPFKPLDYANGKDASRCVTKVGDYLYATVTVGNRDFYHQCNAGIATFDVSDPTSAKLISQTPVPIKFRPRMNQFAHDAPPHKIKPLCDGRYLLINLGARGLAVFDREGSPAEPEYLGLLDMDVVPISARPFVWDDALWVIADGPSDSKDNYVHIYTWKT